LLYRLDQSFVHYESTAENAHHEYRSLYQEVPKHCQKALHTLFLLLGFGGKLTDDSSDLMKRDWLRRAQKYAHNYFNDDVLKMTFCLKDCYNLHKWLSIEKAFIDVDFSKELTEQKFIDADTMASQACAGGVCEIN